MHVTIILVKGTHWGDLVHCLDPQEVGLIPDCPT